MSNPVPTVGDKQYPPSGVLFKGKKPTERSPDHSGSLEISKDLLKDLIERANRGEAIKMSLTGYNNSHPRAGDYIKLTARKDEPYRKGGYSDAKRNDQPPF